MILNSLVESGLKGAVITSGAELKQKIYYEEYDCCILHTNIKDLHTFELLKFIKINKPKIKVILMLSSKDELSGLGIDPDILLTKGVTGIIVETLPMSEILSKVYEHFTDEEINSNHQDPPDLSGLGELQQISDSKFTRLRVADVQIGERLLFNLFHRVGNGQYQLAAKKGSKISKQGINALFSQKGIKHLYFKAKERGEYINFLNELASKSNNTSQSDTTSAIDNFRVGTELIHQEIIMSGLNETLMEQVNSSCSNIYSTINRDSQLRDSLRACMELTGKNHVFTVSFFTQLILLNLPWKSERVSKAVGLGSVLHDIGKLKLDRTIASKCPKTLSDSEMVEFKKHPELGASMLSTNRLIDENTRQIVYQHHEYVNGSGFPLGLSGSRIYPLAKIVSLADTFTNFHAASGRTVVESLKSFLSDRDEVLKFDAEYVKCLVLPFAKEIKKK